MTRSSEPDPIGSLFPWLLALFLGGGLLASMEALIVPRLQLALHLGYARALTVQLVYYAGYLLFAWPATVVTVRFGAVRVMAGALVLMAPGCALLALAQADLRFSALLAALLLLSSGVTALQIACNGLTATAGAPQVAAARFTLLQGFNALGTVLGPQLAAASLLGEAGRGGAGLPFLLLAAGAGLLALPLARARVNSDPPDAAMPTAARLRRVAARPRMLQGMGAIFAYVGAEVTLGSLAVAYLTQPAGGGIAPVAAGRLVSLYWAGAMAGRFAGAAAIRRIAPSRLLGMASGGAVGLVALSVALHGTAGDVALLAVGLCNSVMFPLIYGLALPREAEEVPLGAMLLCMAVVGGAVVPMLTGLLADRLSLRPALVLPGLCYLLILWFARRSEAPFPGAVPA